MRTRAAENKKVVQRSSRDARLSPHILLFSSQVVRAVSGSGKRINDVSCHVQLMICGKG